MSGPLHSRRIVLKQLWKLCSQFLMNSHQVSSSFPHPKALETLAAQARSSLPANPKRAWGAALSANDIRFELMLRSRAGFSRGLRKNGYQDGL